MSKLEWDKTGERYFETGVEKGVLFVFDEGAYKPGVAWNGLTAINESPEGGEANPLYADDIKYLNITSAEDFGATIEAYTYPDEFAECDGSATIAKGVTAGQQKRKMFGLSYVTKIGNDTDDANHGYKIHLIYGCVAAPSAKDYSTINDSPEAITFSWDVSTTPVDVPGFKPTAHIVIDSTKTDEAKLTAFEKTLYGDESSESKLPTPDEVITAFKEA